MRHITISGDIGSGKSLVARKLANLLNYRTASVGQLQRMMAADHGLTTLEANRLAERVPQLDELIDVAIVDLSRQSVGTIFDSRMAWHLVPSAFKVHLIADPAVGAERIWRDRVSHIESYSSAAEAEWAAEQRHRSERTRFKDRHGVDISLLRNYDLVIDTTFASPDEIVAEIRAALTSHRGEVNLRIDTRRINPLPASADWSPSRGSADYPVVGYVRPDFFLLEPARESAAKLAVHGLVPAMLGSEGENMGHDVPKPRNRISADSYA
jgi:CMP/dCMP kinase